ncbi:hypothetical protein MMC34_004849 [Xylographa carneopallida]|nr:hypothetical protein [Xylographa carneopallida]
MGNCFGKESSASDNFATTGRAVGSAPPQPAPRAAVPKISGQGRSLGGGQALDSTDARAAAAKAAEERAARASQPKGKLGQALAKEKQQTRVGILGEASRDGRRGKDADEAAEARNYN